MIRELAAAFMLLTRLPVGRWAGSTPPGPARCFWAYPVVGAAVGAIAGGVYALLHRAGAPPWVAACWTVAASVLVTGALHEDGLADMADGFGGGSTVARKLEIMRDSRVGSYGVLALVFAVGVRVSAVATLAAPSLVATALIAAGALSRGALVIPILLLAPAREDGLASGLRRREPGRALLGLMLALFITMLAVLKPAAAVAAVVASLAAAFGTAALARAQIGGYTGDVLGACAVVVECVALSVLASI